MCFLYELSQVYLFRVTISKVHKLHTNNNLIKKRQIEQNNPTYNHSLKILKPILMEETKEIDKPLGVT